MSVSLWTLHINREHQEWILTRAISMYTTAVYKLQTEKHTNNNKTTQTTLNICPRGRWVSIPLPCPSNQCELSQVGVSCGLHTKYTNAGNWTPVWLLHHQTNADLFHASASIHLHGNNATKKEGRAGESEWEMNNYTWRFHYMDIEYRSGALTDIFSRVRPGTS